MWVPVAEALPILCKNKVNSCSDQLKLSWVCKFWVEFGNIKSFNMSDLLTPVPVHIISCIQSHMISSDFFRTFESNWIWKLLLPSPLWCVIYYQLAWPSPTYQPAQPSLNSQLGLRFLLHLCNCIYLGHTSHKNPDGQKNSWNKLGLSFAMLKLS